MDLIDNATDLVIHVEVKDFDKSLIGKVELWIGTSFLIFIEEMSSLSSPHPHDSHAILSLALSSEQSSLWQRVQPPVEVGCDCGHQFPCSSGP